MLVVADKMPQTSESISVISKLSSLDHQSVYVDGGRQKPQNPFQSSVSDLLVGGESHVFVSINCINCCFLPIVKPV